MQNQSRKMDYENVWLDHKNETLNSTTSNAAQQCSPYFCNSSYIPANTNPAFYNVPHYGSPGFPSYNSYLTEPCHGNIDSYHSCYNHCNAKGHGSFEPFPGAQLRNPSMEQKNCSQINHLQHNGIHPQNHIMRSNRKSNQNKKKQMNSEKNKSDFSFGPHLMNYINTGNDNHQKIFDSRANIYNATPESQLLSVGNGGNRNNILLNEFSSNETNLQYSTASENQTNSNNCYLEQSGIKVESGESIYRQEENITNFANDNLGASNKFNISDDVLTNSIKDVDSMQPLDKAQLPDASKENSLLNTTNTVMYNNVAGEEQIFTLQTICEGQDENGKQVILLLAAPEVQQQIAQGNSPVDRIVETQSAQAEENTSIRGNTGTIENTFNFNKNGLQFEQNKAVESLQEVENIQNDSDITFLSNIDEYFGQEVVVKTSKSKKRKRQTAFSHTQTQSKKLIRSNSEAETAVLEESGRNDLNQIHPCQARFRRSFDHQRWRARLKQKNNSASFKGLQNQYFSQFAKKYFQEKHINDQELRKLMRIMLNKIGGSVMQSIWYCFETLKRNYNARAQ